MANILSIQSHVAYGYVGNRAAVFPLQRLGHEVTAVNTVQFSNHTGYGEWTGDIMPLAHIDAIFAGLEKRQVLQNLDAILTGYLGAAELGEIVLHWLSKIKVGNPQIIYCCDPVMGDVGRGIFVQEDVPAFFKKQALHSAMIMTPNQFELQLLTGIEINTLPDARTACRLLHQQGVEIILLTSLARLDGNPAQIEMLLSTKQESFLIATPKLALPIPINGAGDATTALFLGHYLDTKDLKQSLEKTTASIYALFESTYTQRRRELDLIGSQNKWVNPPDRFSSVIC